IGARDFMPPGTILPKPWKRIDLIIDDPITFSEWAAHADGGSIDDSWVASMMDKSTDDRQREMRKLYRKFSDQLVNTLAMRGAP
ncbi:MAG: hypothetical protein VX461_03070, partial [Candidatus Thermoplasmatota archaeon]|nr:hypothetical protein [Candidatus Thermoplasmatota archaeon]